MYTDNHHWIARDLEVGDADDETKQRWVREGKSFAAGPCDALRFSFGGGSEMSNTPIQFPNNYRYFLDGSEQFGVNLHLIDLRGVAEDEVQRCKECNCDYMYEANLPVLRLVLLSHFESDENPFAGQGGGVQCCPISGMRCKSDVNEPVQYYFRYKIVYNTEEDFDGLIPVYVSVFSASSTTAASCEVEFNAPRCTELGPTSENAGGVCRGGNSTIEFSWLAQSTMDVVFSLGHAHVGTVDGVRAIHVKNDEDGKTVQLEQLCRSEPLFGLEGDIDDSFLVGMSLCHEQRRIEKGDILHVSSTYNAQAMPYKSVNSDSSLSRHIKYPAPYDGVMAYFVMFYTFPDGTYSEFTDVPAEDLPITTDADAASVTLGLGDGSSSATQASSADSCSPVHGEEFEDIRYEIETRSVELLIDDELDAHLTLFWRLSGLESGRIVFGLEYTHVSTEKPPLWMGLGVGSNGMRGSDIVVIEFSEEETASTTEDDIATPLNAATAKIEQFWSTTYGTPTPKAGLTGVGAVPFTVRDCGHDVSSLAGTSGVPSPSRNSAAETMARVYVQFSRPLAAEGEFSESLEAGTTNELIYALGFKEGSFASAFEYHGPFNRGRVQINVPIKSI